MTKPENSSIRRSKVGEQRINRQTLIMNEGRSGGRSASLYNAVNRQEYLRAHSYFAPRTAPDLSAFREDYATTQSVRLRHGEVIAEGAAGTLLFAVPVAIEAVTTEGSAVYTGCYRLSQVQPAAQELPPFRPIGIDSGQLSESDTAFDTAMGTCDLK